MRSLGTYMLFSDVCKPQGALPACNYLTAELLEMLKTASISNVHCNGLLHTYHTAALCTGIAEVCYFQDLSSQSIAFVASTLLLKAETVLIY